jgi:hypothetical protein
MMNKWIIPVIASVLPLLMQAQAPYPAAPPPAGNIIKAEYFFDADPGPGAGTSIAIAAATDVANLNRTINLNGSALTNGFHRLYIRTMDENGAWSHSHNSLFDNYIVPAYGTNSSIITNIVDVEYFIDADPGFGLATPLPVTPGTGIPNVNYIINVTGLPQGLHRLYVRVKDAAGKWSLTHLGIFDNITAPGYPAATTPVQLLTEMEYFIDTDPGLGMGTAIPVSPSTDMANLSVNIPVTPLTAGVHTLYIRSRSNPWSHAAYAPFQKDAILPLTWLFVKGVLQEGSAIISWSTADESNTDRFIVEHSHDGAHYAAIGEVAAKGNSAINNYNYTHDQVTTGFNYYRIKQVDIDGRYTYSKVIPLLYRSNNTTIVVGPNPAQNVLHVILPKTGMLQKLEVYSQDGAKLMQQTVTNAGPVIVLNIQHLPAGVYFLTLTAKDKTETARFIKN